MAKIRISKNHSKSADEIEELVARLEKELCRDLKLTSTRRNNQVLFKKSGVDGALTMADQRVDIDVTLGLMNSLLAPQIESALRSKLDEYLS